MLAELIPSEFFDARSDWLLWLITFGAIPLLVYGADRLVAAAVGLADSLNIPKVIVGATIVSLGTTAPEAAVSVRAAWTGQSGLALGNGLGSIICDSGLIFGMCCLIKPLPLDRFILKRHGWIQFGSVLGLAGLIIVLWLIGGGSPDTVVLGRWVGAVLVGLLGWYLYQSARWARKHPELRLAEPVDVHVKRSHKVLKNLLTAGVLIFGLVLVVFGSEVLVGAVTVICRRHDVPESVLAGTLIAFGTSLPELVTAIASIAKGHPELLVGNIIGADILNILFVIGFSALAKPLQIDAPTFYLLIPTALIMTGLIRFYAAISGSSFRRWQGIPLLAVYVAYLVLLAGWFGI